ncbi:MAG: MFS transporter [Thermoproteota archaeon]
MVTFDSRNRRTLATICAANLAYAFSSSMLGPSLPTIMSALSLDAWEVGSIASVGAVGFLSVLPGGILADKRGKRKLMVAGLLIETFAYVIAGFSCDFYPLLLGLALFGVGAGFWEVAVSAFVPENFRDNPNGAMNVLHSTWGIGGFLGPMLAGLAISASGDWHLGFLVSAGFLAIAASIAHTLGSEGRAEVSPDPRLSRVISSMPKGAVAALALGWGVELGLYAYLPLLLESERGFGALEASAALGFLLLMIAAGRMCWSRLSGRISMVKTIKLSGILACASVLATAASPGPFALLPILSAGFFISSLAPTILAYIGEKAAPSGTGMAIGLTLSAASVGGAAVPASSALVAGSASVSISFAFLGILLFPIFLLVRYP